MIYSINKLILILAILNLNFPLKLLLSSDNQIFFDIFFVYIYSDEFC